MERVSALVDGELEGSEANGVIDRVTREQEARASWDTYNLISDAFRNEYLLSRDVVARVGARLATEPTILAPRVQRSPLVRFQRHALSAAASVAAVAVVGWLAFAYNPPVPDSVSVSMVALPQQAPNASSGGATVQPVALDGNVRAYLFAHQEFSPTTQMQGVAPYIRTVSEVSTNESR